MEEEDEKEEEEEDEEKEMVQGERQELFNWPQIRYRIS